MENKRVANKPCLEYDGNQATFDEFEPPTKQGKTKCQTPSSPPSVTLSLPTTSKSHAYCFICKKPGPKIIVAPSSARQDVFIRKGIVVSAEVRCCPVHLTDGLFTEEALAKITPLSQEVNLNRTNIKHLLVRPSLKITRKDNHPVVVFFLNKPQNCSFVYNLSPVGFRR